MIDLKKDKSIFKQKYISIIQILFIKKYHSWNTFVELICIF